MGKCTLLAESSVRKNKLDEQMCPTYSCDFISEKHRGWSQESLLITAVPIRSKNGSVLSIPRLPLRTGNLKKLKVELVLSHFVPLRSRVPFVPPSGNISAVVDEFDVAHERISSNGTSVKGTRVSIMRPSTTFANNYLSAPRNEADSFN